MMKVIYSKDHARHAPAEFFRGGEFQPYPDVPARADGIAEALRGRGVQLDAPNDFGPAPRAAVHAPDYLRFLETVHGRWKDAGMASDLVFANVHLGRHMAGRPTNILGQVGYFTADLACPIGPETWSTVCDTANVALTAAERVLEGAAEAYAVCRPPGHHAYGDAAGGFCFLNNIAIAAQFAVDRGRRPAIVDVDVHAGNGTQGIFHRRGDVFSVSLHRDPSDYYPYFAGYAQERGEGPGAGAHLNLPLPAGTGDNAYLAALDDALQAVRAFGPDILFVAVGLDGYEHDPLDGFKLTTGGFARIAQALGELELPTVLVQKGGYNVPDIGRNILSFLDGFMTGRGSQA